MYFETSAGWTNDPPRGGFYMTDNCAGISQSLFFPIKI